MSFPRQAELATIDFLYREHHGWLLDWLRRRLGGDTAEAADLSHDTYLCLLRRNVDAVREPRAYLAKIARDLIVNHWRRQDLERAYRQQLREAPPQQAGSPEQELALIETLCELDRLLGTLNPKVRRAFLLAHLDGQTYLEIGARLGVSERMVKKYMAQAMLHCLSVGLACGGQA